MDETAALAIRLMYAVGFRNMLALLGLLGSLGLIWLAVSLPGRRTPRLSLALVCATGAGLLPAMNLPSTPGLALPVWAMRLLCLCTAITILLMALQAARAALLLPAVALSPVWRGPARLLVSRRLSAVVALAGLGLGGLAFWNTVRVPAVREVEIPVAHLPAPLENFTVVQLTDLHLGTIFDAAWLEAVVDRVNALRPDAVAVTGDTGEAGPDAVADALAPLRALRAADGVYYVPGNHEGYQGIDSWARFYRSAGHLLRNSHAVLHRDGAALVLAGIDDAAPDVDAALRDAPAGAPRVLLSHRPATARKVAAHGVALQLSGHTHGGLLPGLKQVIARANDGFVSGLYRVGRMWLYVSNGSGLWSCVTLRLNAPSEITRLRLVPAP